MGRNQKTKGKIRGVSVATWRHRETQKSNGRKSKKKTEKVGLGKPSAFLQGIFLGSQMFKSPLPREADRVGGIKAGSGPEQQKCGDR